MSRAVNGSHAADALFKVWSDQGGIGKYFSFRWTRVDVTAHKIEFLVAFADILLICSCQRRSLDTYQLMKVSS